MKTKLETIYRLYTIIIKSEDQTVYDYQITCEDGTNLAGWGYKTETAAYEKARQVIDETIKDKQI